MRAHLARCILVALAIGVGLATALGPGRTPPASAARTPAIAAGNYHTCAVLGDGTAKCWGYNDKGQLGDNTTTNSSTPVAVSGLTNAVAIAAGDKHTCVLISDGTVKCWGFNFYGQLGDGGACGDLCSIPVTVSGLTNAVAIAAGYSHTCAVLSDGTAKCWGRNAYGRLGDGTTADKNVPAAVCATGATAPCTAANNNILTGTVAIAAGEYHSCALLSDGSAKCWGRNDYGQLGTGAAGANQLTPVAVSGLSNAVAVEVGDYHTCALLSDGSVRCWGYNVYGQLGDDSTTNSNTPVAVSGLTNAVAIAAGSYYTCAVRSDGSGRCWGWNYQGQLGDGSTDERHSPVTVSGLSNVVAITAGWEQTCALVSDGSARCWGYNNYGQLGDSSTTNSSTPVAVSSLSNAVAPAIAAGGYHTCALLSDGTGRCWGWSNYGQLGDSTTTEHHTPVPVSDLSNASAIAAGEYHSCALVSDGTVQCWGDNYNGQLGDNTTGERHTPVAALGLSDAVAIAARGLHTCALLGDGSAQCWGDNGNGQLGDSSITERHTPVVVSGLSHAVAISTGLIHTCALLSDGTARCWGGNGSGQLGDGTTTEQHTPVVVCATGATPPCTAANHNILTGAIAIAAGDLHTCALLSDGTVKCWGYNSNGQLGDSSTTERHAPVAVSGLTNAVGVAAGTSRTCALRSDGGAWCWGLNDRGQLGNNSTADSHTPVAVSGLTNAVAIAAGGFHTCALRSDGGAWCWGYNGQGELGDGTTTERHTPVAVILNPDSDGDGCTESQEAAMGFNPNAWYDYFDVPVPVNPDPTPNGARNKFIDMSDVIAVLFYVGAFDNDVPNANGVDYDSDKNGDTVEDGRDYDRSPSPPPNPPLDAGPPDGAIDMSDVLAALAQVGLDCSGPT